MHYHYPKYVSVAEKKAKAERKLAALKKKNPNIKPVVIEGRAIAKTWWGKAWNENLERYADYANRIGRGRSYVRHMAVLDLQISPGKIMAMVSGSGSSPYKVTITIKPIPQSDWNRIKQQCKGKMDSLKKLMAGKFPKALEDVFTQKGKGLFPAPKEISLNCSCPDWAVMCKHVAAVLYGVGARLDRDPSLFFMLRKANVNDLVSESVKESKKDLLNRSQNKSSRIIKDDAGLSALFGIDLDDADALAPSTGSTQTSALKKPLKKPVRKQPRKTTSNAKAAAKPKSSGTKISGKTPGRIKDVAGVETLFKRRTKSLTQVAEVIEKSDMPPQKVRNIVFALVNQGKLERVSRGVYKWVR
ncbi:SWIM zinc finger [Desulfocicer vacuolatum DSM 3385]|uniref:SWIM zinc finger n=1 Tax=Desulfocicer vacuolatum DSM 3385 TaxID=1121400 RepID=A0A1W2DSF5_9BACT|nr:SWIM zinc finger family protein [Desulfocicer vacuolatum]SMD00339.1 SWIM zinc finger [Desulfocicer vacuolatum DSM 3385]